MTRVDITTITMEREYASVSAANLDRKCFKLKVRKRSLPVDNELLLHDEDIIPLRNYLEKQITALGLKEIES